MEAPMTYYGGKKSMLRFILPLIPRHLVYTEPFVGGGAVFFAKEPAPEFSVINDMNGGIVNLYRVMKTRWDNFALLVDSSLHSRQMHRRATNLIKNPEGADPVQLAWAYWYSAMTSFSSQIGSTYGYTKSAGGDGGRSNAVSYTLFRRKRGMLSERFRQEMEELMSRTNVEQMDGRRLIEKYDIPEAFHFVDPPYVGTECGHYSGVFGDEDLQALLETLAKVKGKFMLTMFPNDTIKAVADREGWVIHEIERNLCATKDVSRRGVKLTEWMVCNYRIEECKHGYQYTDLF